MRKGLFFLTIIGLLILPCFSCFSQPVKIITIQENIINPVTVDYIARGIKAAEQDNAILLIELDTPGGLLKSTEKIVKLLLNANIPVITYVYPQGSRAASAGVFISYACNILAMTPSSHIGAAHPIIGTGKWGSLDETIQTKIVNDVVAWAKTIAQQRNRPQQFIVDAIQKSISITAEQARQQKVCDVIAVSVPELLAAIDGKKVTTASQTITLATKNTSVETIELTLREKILGTIIDPNIAYLLLLLGFLGLIFEVTHPGFGVPGIAGIIALILSFYALSVLPLNYAGLTLLLLGIIFFIVESLTPTFGMFTAGGVAAFILGSLMLFNQPRFIKVSLSIILPTVVLFAGLTIFLMGRSIIVLRRKSRIGVDGLLASIGTAKTDIATTGKVFVHGELWNARSQEKIKKGQRVVIEKVDGLTLVVRKYNN